MIKKLFVTTVLIGAITGCSANPNADRAFRKFMVGHDGLTCSESYQERLIEGETQEYAQANYDACIAKNS